MISYVLMLFFSGKYHALTVAGWLIHLKKVNDDGVRVIFYVLHILCGIYDSVSFELIHTSLSLLVD